MSIGGNKHRAFCIDCATNGDNVEAMWLCPDENEGKDECFCDIHAIERFGSDINHRMELEEKLIVLPLCSYR